MCRRDNFSWDPWEIDMCKNAVTERERGAIPTRMGPEIIFLPVSGCLGLGQASVYLPSTLCQTPGQCRPAVTARHPHPHPHMGGGPEV